MLEVSRIAQDSSKERSKTLSFPPSFSQTAKAPPTCSNYITYLDGIFPFSEPPRRLPGYHRATPDERFVQRFE